MKKFLLLFLLFVSFSSGSLFSQKPAFFKGDAILNLGLGIYSTLFNGTYYEGKIPPLSAVIEFGVTDHILEKGVVGVGPYIGYSYYKYEYMDGGEKYYNHIIGVKGNFHYPLVDNLDTYTGFLVGYLFLSAKEFGESSGEIYEAPSSRIAWSWVIGTRYYIAENFGLMAELGYGISYFTVGGFVNFNK